MNRPQGFTLMEMIAVIAIIAVLAAIVLPVVFGQIRKGRVSRMIEETSSIKSGSLKYFGDHAFWPFQPIPDGAILALLQPTPALLAPAWGGPYLEKAPRRRSADNRFSNLYDGFLMLNDLDDGSGDDATADRNANAIGPDRFCYEGLVPVLDAALLDLSVDGTVDPETGNIILFVGTDWSSSTTGTAEILFIIAEAF